MVTDAEKARFAALAAAFSGNLLPVKEAPCDADVLFDGGIGTYNEKTTHRVLKSFFEPDVRFHEVPCGAYVADIKRDNRIIEIQTSGFAAIRGRLDFFLQSNKVTLVYPIYKTKRIVWVDPENGLSEKSVRSPKRGSELSLLPELGRIGDLFLSGGIEVKCMLLEGTEYRLRDGWGNDGKRGAHRIDRIPGALVDIISVCSADDLRALIPFDSGDSFTSKEFAKACGFSKRSWRDIGMAIKFLMQAGIAEHIGKEGRAFLYRVT